MFILLHSAEIEIPLMTKSLAEDIKTVDTTNVNSDNITDIININNDDNDDTTQQTTDSSSSGNGYLKESIKMLLPTGVAITSALISNQDNKELHKIDKEILEKEIKALRQQTTSNDKDNISNLPNSKNQDILNNELLKIASQMELMEKSFEKKSNEMYEQKINELTRNIENSEKETTKKLTELMNTFYNIEKKTPLIHEELRGEINKIKTQSMTLENTLQQQISNKKEIQNKEDIIKTLSQSNKELENKINILSISLTESEQNMKNELEKQKSYFSQMSNDIDKTKRNLISLREYNNKLTTTPSTQQGTNVTFGDEHESANSRNKRLSKVNPAANNNDSNTDMRILLDSLNKESKIQENTEMLQTQRTEEQDLPILTKIEEQDSQTSYTPRAGYEYLKTLTSEDKERLKNNLAKNSAKPILNLKTQRERRRSIQSFNAHNLPNISKTFTQSSGVFNTTIYLTNIDEVKAHLTEYVNTCERNDKDAIMKVINSICEVKGSISISSLKEVKNIIIKDLTSNKYYDMIYALYNANIACNLTTRDDLYNYLILYINNKHITDRTKFISVCESIVSIQTFISTFQLKIIFNIMLDATDNKIENILNEFIKLNITCNNGRHNDNHSTTSIKSTETMYAGETHINNTEISSITQRHKDDIIFLFKQQTNENDCNIINNLLNTFTQISPQIKDTIMYIITNNKNNISNIYKEIEVIRNNQFVKTNVQPSISIPKLNIPSNINASLYTPTSLKYNNSILSTLVEYENISNETQNNRNDILNILKKEINNDEEFNNIGNLIGKFQQINNFQKDRIICAIHSKKNNTASLYAEIEEMINNNITQLYTTPNRVRAPSNEPISSYTPRSPRDSKGVLTKSSALQTLLQRPSSIQRQSTDVSGSSTIKNPVIFSTLSAIKSTNANHSSMKLVATEPIKEFKINKSMTYQECIENIIATYPNTNIQIINILRNIKEGLKPIAITTLRLSIIKIIMDAQKNDKTKIRELKEWINKGTVNGVLCIMHRFSPDNTFVDSKNNSKVFGNDSISEW